MPIAFNDAEKAFVATVAAFVAVVAAVCPAARPSAAALPVFISALRAF